MDDKLLLPRRGVLRVLAAPAVAGLGAFTPGRVQSRTDRNLPDLCVVIEINGRQIEFDMAKGRDLGNYIDPKGQFTQRCVLVEDPNSEFRVMFRPDLGAERIEVVFEHGRTDRPAGDNAEPYRAVILSGGRQLAAVKVQEHYRFARWRWQSKPRPVRSGPRELFAARSIPTLDRAHVHRAIRRQAVEFAPMGFPGLDPNMYTSGEREEIGLVTEAQAEYLMFETSEALRTMLAQAEAAGSCPWHLRDAAGRPLDLDQQPMFFVAADERALQRGPGVIATRSVIRLDPAHEPALVYVPFLLTGDPYYLEALQHQTQWNWFTRPPFYRPWRQDAALLGTVTTGQIRAMAWSLRNLFHAVTATPENVPSWLHPPGYWRRKLAANRLFMERTAVRNTAPEFTVFRCPLPLGNATSRDEPNLPWATWFPSWQVEYLTGVIGGAVKAGQHDWRDVLEWLIGGTVARANGKSGWRRAYASPYRLKVRSAKSDPVASSWAEAWAINARDQGWPMEPADQWASRDTAYLSYLRGTLALARQAGLSIDSAAVDWTTAEYQRLKAGYYCKWAFRA